MLIKSVSAETTWPIRHEVMWPELPMDFVKLENDSKGKHYAIFVNDNIVSCISLFIEGDSAQFRKLATTPQHQRKGCASALINHVKMVCYQDNIKRLWCNARVDKANFYENFGMAKTNKFFTKAGLEFVIMEGIL
ncbi:GNAT family N-acetyltransferase [Maribacter cobaltidurans]|uniref:GNAT family N-acetyltransferase n=1 Tax=Maribacter cobaltidurans TaxID=1178778 RepID=A0A223VAG2_9FLAO|nr:GNAT family N-acetyltransferase [Maribacter cobaltidurans]ASV32316.1 GNAT family N-acetyltransferase [Maribacter cobaltidurans]